MSQLPGGPVDEWMARAMGGMTAPIAIDPQMLGSIPNPNMGGGLGGLARRAGVGLQNGLGRLRSGLFPVDPATAQGMAPEQLQAMQGQAMMQMGLGLLAAKSRGQGLGEGLAEGYGAASDTLQGAMQRAFQNKQLQNTQRRADDREDRMLEQQKAQQERYDAMLGRQLERDEQADKRYESERAHELEREKVADARWKAEQDATAQWRQTQIDGATKNPEVRVTDRGMFERDPASNEWKLVPGTEPTGVSGRPIPQGMANDMKTNASVLNQIDQLLPRLRDPKTKEFTKEARDAFGAGNAVVNMLTPDGISDNVKNFFDSDGAELRSIVTNMNSYVVKERNGAAVTVAEFARQRGFLPTDSDSEEVIETKLKSLRKAVADEQQYMVDFAESQGYRPPPATMSGRGNWSVEQVGE